MRFCVIILLGEENMNTDLIKKILIYILSIIVVVVAFILFFYVGIILLVIYIAYLLYRKIKPLFYKEKRSYEDTDKIVIDLRK